MMVKFMSVALYKVVRKYQQLTIRYDVTETSIWFYLNPSPRACFTSTLLYEINQFQESVRDAYGELQREGRFPINYVVLASQTPDTFNLGGDLNLFAELIINNRRQELMDYAKACIRVLYANATNLALPVTTISLVEGSALGGGFEAALSSNILVAERSAEMGLPEILFNLFPGMGAYSLLARRLGMIDAEKIITSGRIYSAAELFDMGVVDVLAEDGAGQEQIRRYIKQHNRSSNGLRAVHAARQRFNPLDYKELLDIAEIWVNAALKLKPRDIRMMQRLVSAQNRHRYKNVKTPGQAPVNRSKQDRRMTVNETFPLVDHQGDVIETDRRHTRDRRGGRSDKIKECSPGHAGRKLQVKAC